MKKIKKGDISTAFITILSLFMISVVFFQNIMMNLEVEKYNVLNQYTRDALLICETQPQIEITDLVKIRKALVDKLCKKENQSIDFSVTIGDNAPKLILNGSTGVIKPLYGQQIKIEIVYTHIPFRFVNAGLLVKRGSNEDSNKETMGVSLATTSKARSVV